MSPQELLDSVDHLKVWEHLVGESRLNHRFLRPSWLGGDHRPDCKLGLKKGKVRYYDPPRGLSWDILDGYAAKYPQDDWTSTVENMLSWSGTSKATIDQLNKNELWVPNFILTPRVVEWSDWGKEYWAKRGVDYTKLSHKAILTQEICGYETNTETELGSTYFSQMARGFVYWANGHCKCYFPEEVKDRKFRGRLKANDCWLVDRNKYRQLENKPDTKTLLVAKSNKDMLVWLQFVSCDLACVAAEGSFPDAEWLLNNVRMKYERVLIIFDPDSAGLKGANDLQMRLLSISEVGNFAVKVWPWPDPVSKDIDQYRVDNGFEQTIHFLKANNFHKIFDP